MENKNWSEPGSQHKTVIPSQQHSGAYQGDFFLSDLPQHLAPGAGMFSPSTAVFSDTMSSPPRGTPEVRPVGQEEAKRKKIPGVNEDLYQLSNINGNKPKRTRL